MAQGLCSSPEQLGWAEGFDQMITSVQTGIADTMFGVAARGLTMEEALGVQGALNICMTQVLASPQAMHNH